MVLSPGAVPDPHGYFRGDPYGPREVTRVKTPEKELARRAERQQKARERMEVRETKQILFGDTHVHTTYSTDAFRFSLPFWQGSRGAFPPADACDYARYVSQIDFYFLTDHAESYAPEQWRDAVESVRQWNGVAGDPKNPDVAAFIGWEWTQMGLTPEGHFGHHNVLFRDTEPGRIPSRPIAAAGVAVEAIRGPMGRVDPVLYDMDAGNRSYYEAFNLFSDRMGCSLGVIIFAIAFFIMVKIAPFSVVKEIEVDQNTSLAILFGSVFIGLAIIISSAIA